VDDKTLSKIENDQNYIKLVQDRKSFGWTLTILMLVIYYGYIAVVAFAPGVIATFVAGSITIGLILGAAIIVAAVLLTGIYVLRANAEYDDLTNAIIKSDLAGGAK
jgi:uncharacterized membrane protein (DUF485 family)